MSANDAMKDIERLADHYANYKHARMYPQATEAKSALLAAIGKLVAPQQEPLGSTILSCGCRSQWSGFPAEWDGETRECTPAVMSGALCERHYHEWDARPANQAAQPSHPQDAQPVAPRKIAPTRYYLDPASGHMVESKHGPWMQYVEHAEAMLTHPPIPQEGKVMEALESTRPLLCALKHREDDAEAARSLALVADALALLRSQVQGGLSTNNEEMK